MKNVWLGVALGAAGVAATCLIVKLYKEGRLDGVCNDLNTFVSRRRRDLKNVVDTSKNQLDYMKERVEYGVQSAKEKLNSEE